VVHSTALNSSDNLHSYPPDNHHSSDDIYDRGGGLNSGCLLNCGAYRKTSNYRHLFEHGPQNPGINWRPGVY